MYVRTKVTRNIFFVPADSKQSRSLGLRISEVCTIKKFGCPPPPPPPPSLKANIYYRKVLVHKNSSDIIRISIPFLKYLQINTGLVLQAHLWHCFVSGNILVKTTTHTHNNEYGQALMVTGFIHATSHCFSLLGHWTRGSLKYQRKLEAEIWHPHHATG